MTPNATACPSPEDIRRILQGKVSDPHTSLFEEHLEGCERCQRVVAGTPTPAPVVALLRSTAARRTSTPAECLPADVAARLERMSSRPSWGALIPSDDGHVPPLAPPEAPGELGHLGPYRVLAQIGAGGMGLVYRAVDTRLLRAVALKLLRPRFASHESARGRFLREARAMAALKHDHVVTVFEVGEVPRAGGGTVPYLAMELLEGQSLAAWMKVRPPAPAAWVAKIGREAALGLAAAHAGGLIHRDIKPGNLWLETAPGAGGLDEPAGVRVKLLDFGLADPLGRGADPGDRRAGTPAYMAPEQARGDRLDHRTDLYALGVVLYELATGRLPDESAALVPVRQLAPALPPALGAVIEQLLAGDPVDRTASADEVAARLAAFCPSAEDTPARRRRKKRLAALAVAGAVAVAAFHLPLGGPPRTEPAAITVPSGLPDDEWERAVARLPRIAVYPAVVARLRERNPDFAGPVPRVVLDGDEVVELDLRTDSVVDVRPLRPLTGLRRLTLSGTRPESGRLAELSPLRDLRLEWVNVSNNPALRDLGPIAGTPFVTIIASDTAAAIN